MSGYGVRAGRRTGEPTFHAGIDIGVPAGSIIYAPRAGVATIVTADSDPRSRGFNGYGNAVVLHHADENVYSFYAHMSRALVAQGASVAIGQPIGVVGNTSNGKFPGMGRHLHMEVRRARPDGSSPYPGGYARFNIDPQEWLRAHGVIFTRDVGVAPDGEACISPVDRQLAYLPTIPARVPAPGSGALLGARGLAGSEDGDEYEPPIPEPGFYQPLSAIASVAIPGSLIAVGLGGLALYLRER